jgi:hypothetical protein
MLRRTTGLARGRRQFYTKQGNPDFLRELDRNGALFLLIGGDAVAQ